MLIYKNKAFHRWSKKMRLSDKTLKIAIDELNQGNYEANLGGNIYKKRIGIRDRGKRGGARTIVAFKFQNKAIFIYGYEKNVRANIYEKEEIALKALAKVYLGFNEQQISKAIKAGELIEVKS